MLVLHWTDCWPHLAHPATLPRCYHVRHDPHFIAVPAVQRRKILLLNCDHSIWPVSCESLPSLTIAAVAQPTAVRSMTLLAVRFMGLTEDVNINIGEVVRGCRLCR